MIMKSVKQVEKILEENPEARSNDFLLCWLWLQKQYNLELPELSQEQLYELRGKFSTLPRWRRKIQSSGKYLPTHIETRRVGGRVYQRLYKNIGKGSQGGQFNGVHERN